MLNLSSIDLMKDYTGEDPSYGSPNDITRKDQRKDKKSRKYLDDIQEHYWALQRQIAQEQGEDVEEIDLQNIPDDYLNPYYDEEGNFNFQKKDAVNLLDQLTDNYLNEVESGGSNVTPDNLMKEGASSIGLPYQEHYDSQTPEVQARIDAENAKLPPEGATTGITKDGQRVVAIRDEEGNITGSLPIENVSEQTSNTTPSDIMKEDGLADGAVIEGSFNEAFGKARSEGLNTFTWNGKSYGTELANVEEDEDDVSIPGKRRLSPINLKKAADETIFGKAKDGRLNTVSKQAENAKLPREYGLADGAEFGKARTGRLNTVSKQAERLNTVSKQAELANVEEDEDDVSIPGKRRLADAFIPGKRGLSPINLKKEAAPKAADETIFGKAKDGRLNTVSKRAEKANVEEDGYSW